MNSGPGIPAIRSDPATAARIAELQDYHDRNVLRGSECICASLSECRASHPGAFYAGQLSHVGAHYDLYRDGKPLRIVVVGQEYGHGPEGVTMSERRAMVLDESASKRRFRASGGFAARNPHMKGCTSLLRCALGCGPGADYEGEFVDLGGERVHVFECFALVNFLLCSAVAGGGQNGNPRLAGKPGRSTSIMRIHCAEHFRASLDILEPTLVVAQGHGVREWIGLAFGLPPRVPDCHIERLPIRGGQAALLAFSHPSARAALNWGRNERTPYLLDVVVPAVRRALGSI